MSANFNKKAHHPVVFIASEEVKEIFKQDSEAVKISQFEDLIGKDEKQLLDIANSKNGNLYIFTAMVVIASSVINVFPVLSSGITAAVAVVALIKVVEDILYKREVDFDRKILWRAIDERIKCMQSKLSLSGFYDVASASMRDKFNRNSILEKENSKNSKNSKLKKKKRKFKLKRKLSPKLSPKLNPKLSSKQLKNNLSLKCG